MEAVEQQREFKCPRCHQKYDVPPVTVEMIVGHMGRHGVIVDHDFVLRRLIEKPTKES